ncbi:MAG: acetyl-CoA carboxylase biotin carboxyl carrier protein [Chlamydiales bacterium]|nr:acetyl-CoA carboxylase biotin carboxyl carrier protein [Chlamydiales bacterium]
MDLEKIKELMAAMEEKGMTKVALKDKSGFELEIERSNAFEVASYTQAPVMHHMPRVAEAPQAPKEEAAKPASASSGQEISSPMVGTFYASPSPDADPFVKVGDTVTEDTVIGIIEAMKVMNEIKAGKAGTITEILVDNAHPVEFGTKILTLA